MFSIFRVYFVSLLFRMLMYFFTFCMFSRVVCKFPFVYICVIPSCSFSASPSSGTLLTSWFSEPRCQHFGIYLPPMESQIHLLVSTNWISLSVVSEVGPLPLQLHLWIWKKLLVSSSYSNTEILTPDFRCFEKLTFVAGQWLALIEKKKVIYYTISFLKKTNWEPGKNWLFIVISLYWRPLWH